MAHENTEVAKELGAATPIASLTPETSRNSAVQGVITIVWPYNKVKNSIAFILAEPEFRLRRAKGQVRVNFVGSSAKAISECGLGSSDNVRLSLEGAELVPNDAKARIPGTEVDWQLNFSERVTLQVKFGQSGETKNVNVDHPERPQTALKAPTPPPPAVEIEIPSIDLPHLPDLSSVTPFKSAALKRLKDDEFESPAFVKRARISYGSLFEDDIFEDNEGESHDKRKGRKRTRFSLNPSSWRYGSQSPSPESPSAEEDGVDKAEEVNSSPPPRPQMTDSECQTMELDFPGPPPVGPVLDHALDLLGVQRPHPLLQTGGLVDQGHQTFPISDWASRITEAHQPFSNPGLFGSTQAAAPFDSPAGAAVNEIPGRDEWNAQPTPNESAPYPEFPLEVPQDLFVPSVEQSFDTASSHGTGGVTDAGYEGSLLHPTSYETASTIDGHAFEASGSAEKEHELLPHSSSIYPELEDEKSHQHSPIRSVPLDARFVKPGILLAEETATVPANPFGRETGFPSERAAMNAGTSSWAAVNHRTASRSLSRPLSSQRGSGDGQTPQSAMVIDESDSDENGKEALLVDATEADLGDAPVSLPENAGRALAHATVNPFIEDRPSGNDGAEEDWKEEERAYADHSPDRYEDEYDEDDDGGDYNTSTYLAPQDDEDDANDMDLQTHRLEPEFRDSEAESWEEDELEREQVEEFDDDEEDEEDQEEYEDDSEMDAATPQQPQQQAARPASSAPVFIDLLSDSDDDNDEPPPRPPPSTMPISRVPVTSFPTAADSPDYGPGSDEELEEDEEDELESDATDAGGSGQSNEDIDPESERVLPKDGVSDDIESQDFGSEVAGVEDVKQNEPFEQISLEESIIPSQQPQTEEIRNVSASESQLHEKIRTPSPQMSSKETITAVIDENMEDAIIGHKPIAETQPQIEDSLTSVSSEEQQPEQVAPMERTDSMLEEPEKVNQGGLTVDVGVEETWTQSTLDTVMAAPLLPPLTQSFPTQSSEERDIVMKEIAEIDEVQIPTFLDTQLEGSQMTEATISDLDTVDETSRQTADRSSPIMAIDESESMNIIGEEIVTTVGLSIQERTESAITAWGTEQTQEEDLESVQGSKSVLAVNESIFESQVGDSDALSGAFDRISQVMNQVSEGLQQETRDEVSEASPSASHLHGDDALQAALREEDSRYFDQDIQGSTVAGDATSDIANEDILQRNESSSRHSSLTGEEAEAPAFLSRVQEREPNTTTPDIANDSSSRASSPVEEQRQTSSVPSPDQAENSDSRAASPDLETVPEHVNESGIRIGSPEWAAKERHGHEEPNVGDSPFPQTAIPVTHKNEAGVTVGSPERAAIERHQPLAKEVPSSSPIEPTRGKNETHSDVAVSIPTRAVVEGHEQIQKQVGKRSPTVKSTPAKNKAHSEIVMGSPEKTAKRRSGSKEVHEFSMSDPSIRLARAAIASKNALYPHDTTPDNTRPHTRSRSFQKSPTPENGDESVQLAKASLNTPSKATRADAQVPASSPASSRLEEEAGSLTASKLKLVRHLRDDLQECTALKVLRQHTGKSVEAMAVAMMTPPEPERAKGGPREYMMSFTITDHSISPGGVAEVQLYRPHKESLPRVKTGDVVLLRNFTVVSLRGKGYGLRTNDGSSWAVFEGEVEPAQIKGPPVEYGDAETTSARYLREWYGLLDEQAKQKLEKANQKIIEAGRTKWYLGVTPVI